jgi:phosphoribosylglycinamide formyltransferase 1
VTEETLFRKQRIALLVSGSGSNAEVIMERFRDHTEAEVVFVGCNRSPDRAGIYARSMAFGLETVQFSRDELSSGQLTNVLQQEGIDWIVLAGFLMQIPAEMVAAFDHRMINIHPALLPKFGGKGMYNHHVHEAVAQAGELESGMTVHWVNAAYDEGDILFQASCALEEGDTADIIGAKVLALEHRYYADVLESVIRETRRTSDPLSSRTNDI